MCITHRHRQQYGISWRGGSEGWVKVGKWGGDGDICNSVNKKLILKIKENIFRKKQFVIICIYMKHAYYSIFEIICDLLNITLTYLKYFVFIDSCSYGRTLQFQNLK